jgi:hypothetical protein
MGWVSLADGAVPFCMRGIFYKCGYSKHGRYTAMTALVPSKNFRKLTKGIVSVLK